MKSARKKGKQELFDDSSDEEEQVQLKTNENYAKSYNEFRKKELIQKLKDKGDLGEDDSSSDDLSTDEEVVNPEFDKEFLKTISYLVKRDPGKYEDKTQFFNGVKPVEEFIREKLEKKDKSKPVTITDYKRDLLLKHGAGFVEEDNEEAERPASPSYVQEQERLRSEFKKVLESDSDDDEDLLVKREKSKTEEVRDEEDYLEWLAGQKEEAPETVRELEPLKEFWSSDKLSNEDKFLRDYILNKRYLSKEGVPSYEEIVGDVEEDEKEVERQDEFEQKYNFRYEEPDKDFLKRYPRTIPDSVRAVDSKRKEKRKERQERKEQEKLQKRRDLDELNKMRKEELEEKIRKLREVAQNENFNLKDEDLESEFDPDEHDRRMREAFNDEYYGVNEGEQKPEFPDLDRELDIEDYDNYDPKADKQEEEEETGHCEDDDFIMDADYDPEKARREKEARLQEELIESTRKRKKRKRGSRLVELIKQDKPMFDPEEKSYEDYLDEYYKLDYEDVIGDTPCRFKYSETIANDFGLTIEEILMASNKELNAWASLKKTMQERPKQAELSDLHKYRKRAQNMELKKKILKSIYGEQADEKLDENIESELKTEEPTEPEESVPKKPKKKKKKAQAAESEEPETKTEVKTETKPEGEPEASKGPLKPLPSPKKSFKSPKPSFQKKTDFSQKNAGPRKNGPAPPKGPWNPNLKKSFKAKHRQPHQPEMSEARLRAFGINPKKHFNKIKYGSKPNQQQGGRPQQQQNGKGRQKRPQKSK